MNSTQSLTVQGARSIERTEHRAKQRATKRLNRKLRRLLQLPRGTMFDWQLERGHWHDFIRRGEAAGFRNLRAVIDVDGLVFIGSRTDGYNGRGVPPSPRFYVIGVNIDNNTRLIARRRDLAHLLAERAVSAN